MILLLDEVQRRQSHWDSSLLAKVAGLMLFHNALGRRVWLDHITEERSFHCCRCQQLTRLPQAQQEANK